LLSSSVLYVRHVVTRGLFLNKRTKFAPIVIDSHYNSFIEINSQKRTTHSCALFFEINYFYYFKILFLFYNAHSVEHALHVVILFT
jgi:hypothetical protein